MTPASTGVLNPIRTMWNSPWTGYLLGLAMVSGGLAHLIRSYFNWQDTTAVGIALLVAAALGSANIGRRSAPDRGIALLWSALPLLLVCVWYFFVTVFGEFNIWAVLFHIQMGMETPAVVRQYLNDAVPALAGFLLVLVGWGILASRDERLRRHDRWAFALLLLANPIFFQLAFMAQAEVGEDGRLAARFVDVAAVGPVQGKKRNYIHIFLESAERTYFDEAFGDVMSPIAPLEARGFSSTGLRQTALTGWSAAGIAAANCGVPLFAKGLMQSKYLEFVPEFLPSATCIGDLLARDGYALTFVMGAEMKFAGIGNLFARHGYNRLIGGQELDELYKGSKSAWGPDDEVVFQGALDEVRRLAATGKNYGITVDTAGGHAPNGHISSSCADDPAVSAISPAILRGTKCTNILAARFLKQLEEEGLLKDTVVVVQSDHLAMRSPVTQRLDALERRNLFFVYGDGIEPQRVNKPASPADIMPTILEFLGYRLPERRAGLGVSLRAGQLPSLVEAMGEAQYDDAVLRDSVLGDRLWSDEALLAGPAAPSRPQRGKVSETSGLAGANTQAQTN